MEPFTQNKSAIKDINETDETRISCRTNCELNYIKNNKISIP